VAQSWLSRSLSDNTTTEITEFTEKILWISARCARCPRWSISMQSSTPGTVFRRSRPISPAARGSLFSSPGSGVSAGGPHVWSV